MATYAQWYDAGPKEVSVECSRCKKTVNGFENLLGTAGFYRVVDAPWSRYALEGETALCDSCLWVDDKYVSDRTKELGRYTLCQHYAQNMVVVGA